MFFCRVMLCKCGLCCHTVTICLSVRPSVTFMDSIETNIPVSSKILSPSGSHTILVFQHQRMETFHWRLCNRRVKCRWDRQKLRFSANIWLSIDDWWSANNCNRPPCSLLHRLLCISVDNHDEEKRTELNLFVHSVKSEAEVTNNRRLHLTSCTIEADYWQTRSIATSGLLVTYHCLTMSWFWIGSCQ